MFKKGLALLISAFLLPVSVLAAETAKPYACVLNFEKKAHPFSAKLERKLSDLNGVRIIQEALPSDILKCLDDGVVSVMVIAHAGDLENDRQVTAPMVYFKELKGDARQRFLDTLGKQIEVELDQAKKQNLKKSAIRRIEDAKRKVAAIPPEYPVYNGTKILENRIWRRVLEKPENLKKLSIVACMPEKVAAYYPELKELQSHGIDVEFAPVSWFVSLFTGKNSVVSNFGWMHDQLEDARAFADVPVARAKVLPADDGAAPGPDAGPAVQAAVQ